VEIARNSTRFFMPVLCKNTAIFIISDKMTMTQSHVSKATDYRFDNWVLISLRGRGFPEWFWGPSYQLSSGYMRLFTLEGKVARILS
jgi:hypothetical protein